MRLVVFSDLDGTLLDHETYDMTPAMPALERLADIGAPVILASSKTASEIFGWQQRLGLSGLPAIVENGAAILDGADDDTDYHRIRQSLTALPAELRQRFQGFGDMDDRGVAEATGLSLAEARMARSRAHSEPGVWSGSEAELRSFLAALAERGLSARRGGRFLTLSFGATKAQRMAELARRFQADLTVALGDAPNDAEMIESADRGIIVRNDHGTALPPLAGEQEGRILRTGQSGPAGWAEGIAAVLRDCGLSGDGEKHG